MRADMAKRLQRAIWRQRLITYVPTALLLIGGTLIGGWVFSFKLDRADPTVAMTQVDGTVLEAHRVASKVVTYIAHVRLANGKEIDADSTLPVLLPPNEHVVLNEMRHASGKTSYHVLQVKH